MSRRVEPPATLGQALSAALWMLVRRPHWLVAFSLPAWAMLGATYATFQALGVNFQKWAPLSGIIYVFVLALGIAIAGSLISANLNRLRRSDGVAIKVTRNGGFSLFLSSIVFAGGIASLGFANGSIRSLLPPDALYHALVTIFLFFMMTLLSISLFVRFDKNLIASLWQNGFKIIMSGVSAQLVFAVSFFGIAATLFLSLSLATHVFVQYTQFVDLDRIQNGMFATILLLVVLMLHPVMYAHLYELLYTRRYGAGIEGLEEEF